MRRRGAAMIPRQHRIAKQKKTRLKKIRRRLRKAGEKFYIYDLKPSEFDGWDA